MKSCFNEATTLKNSTLQDDLTLTDKAGFAYIEIWLCQLEKYLQNHTLGELNTFFQDHKIKPFALDSFEDILFRNRQQYSQLKSQFEKACEYGCAIGCHRAVMVPTVQKGLHQQYSKEDINEEAQNVLCELSDIAKPYAMQLAFEPIGFSDCAVRSIAHAWEIVQKVDRDNVGLTLDIFNNYLYCALGDVEDIKKLDTDKVFIFHVDDAPVMPLDQYKPDHSDRVLPGDGGLPCENYITTLKEIGYDEVMSIELFNPALYSMDASEVIPLAYEKVAAMIEKFN